jgi:very-short-patch-repair endonuclease
MVANNPIPHGVRVTAVQTRVSRRLRKSMGLTERRVWVRLQQRKRDGWKFRRQHPIGPYYVDFCCPAARLVVEINGPTHEFEEQWLYDERRRAWLEGQGYRVLTVPVEDVDGDVGVVVEWIEAELLEREALGLKKRPSPSGPSGHLPINGEEKAL